MHKLNEKKSNYNIVGFVKCINDMMSLVGEPELSNLACQTLVLIGQKQFKELFLG